MSIPEQQEAQEACCVDAGCKKEHPSVKEAVEKQMSSVRAIVISVQSSRN